MVPAETLAFLRIILPPENGVHWYAGLVLDGPHRPQHFFRTIAELAAWLIACDQKGQTAYHACAVFKDPYSRKAVNVACASSIWCDIDCGPGKDYENPVAAKAALDEFCHRSGLPMPVLVGSGGGWHAYWPLTAPVSPEEWIELARGLEVLGERWGLKLDPNRTTDIASVLRPPGTHNYKPEVGGALVRVVGELSSYPRARLAVLQEAGSGGTRRPSRRHHKAGASARHRVIDNIDYISPSVFGPNPSDAHRVAAQCNQVRAFKESGDLREPIWRLNVGVVAFCTDGPELVHEWSQNDFPDYDYDQTQDYIDRAQALGSPITCAEFKRKNPAGCSGCKHWGTISTPLQLGRDAAAPALPTVTDVADGTSTLPPLPENFTWTSTKQLALVKGTKDEPEYILITNEPFFLSEVQRSEAGQERYSYLFKHHLPHRGWRLLSFEPADILGPTAIATLAVKGVVVHDLKWLQHYVKAAVNAFNDRSPTGIRYDQFGWKNNFTAYFHGKHLYTPGGKIETSLSGEVAERAPAFGPQNPLANLQLWSEAADNLFGGSCLPLGISILSAFAAPLMSLLLKTPGGCILHLYSASGRGKSWAQDGAMSVWGLPRAMKLLNDDTRVSKAIVMRTLNNGLICYDEVRITRDPEAIKALVGLFSDGRDRLRGTSSGDLVRHTEAGWCTILNTNGNIDLVGLLETKGVDAPGMRVLQLALDDTIEFDKETANRMKTRLEDNCGTAGDRFLKYLVKPDVTPWLKDKLEEVYQLLWRETGLKDHHRFRVACVACILVAGRIVTSLDMLHFDLDRIREYLIHELRDPSNQGTVSDVPTLQAMQDHLADFLNDLQGEVLVVPNKFMPGRDAMQPIGNVPRGRISIRYELGTHRVYIANSIFREWCARKQIPVRQMVEQLKLSQVIMTAHKRMTLTAGTSLIGSTGDTIEINADHPCLSSTLTAIDRLTTEDGADNG